MKSNDSMNFYKTSNTFRSADICIPLCSFHLSDHPCGANDYGVEDIECSSRCKRRRRSLRSKEKTEKGDEERDHGDSERRRIKWPVHYPMYHPPRRYWWALRPQPRRQAADRVKVCKCDDERAWPLHRTLESYSTPSLLIVIRLCMRSKNEQMDQNLE